MFIKELAQFLVDFTLKYGLVGIGTSMLVESLGIPMASISLQLTAGVLIAKGRASFLSAVTVATIGLTMGSLIGYYIGFFAKSLAAKGFNIGEKLKNKPGRVRVFIEKHGEASIFFAQLFGPTRTFISVPAGIMRMDLKKFVIYTFCGGFIYCSLAVGFSVLLSKIITFAYEFFVGQLMKFIYLPFWTGVVLAIILLLASYLVFRSSKTLRKNNAKK